MHRHRLFRLACALLLLPLLLGAPLVRPPAARAVGGWTPAAPPAIPQGGRVNGATVLQDGRVLATIVIPFSSEGPVRGTAQLYDPAADRWSPAAPFDPLAGHANPLRLPDGRVLFTSGWLCTALNPSSCGPTGGAQVYDPASDRWAPVAQPRIRRHSDTATLLPDGTVLVVGGDTGRGPAPPFPISVVERYDPRTDRWTDAAPLSLGRAHHSAVLLRDGRLLVFGGHTSTPAGSYSSASVATAEIYDPATDRWTPAASLDTPLTNARPTLLQDGRVLLLGTRPDAVGGGEVLARLYDPAADRWSPATPPAAPGGGPGSVLPDGRVLVVGPGARLYDPARDIWADAAPPADPHAGATALLRDGRVLLLGPGGAELYTDTPEPRACFAETGQCVGGRFLDYWARNGGLARNGFPLTGVRIETLEDGQAYQVQYFERVRLEYHPENPPPYDVLLGHFGRRVLRAQFGGVNNAVALFQEALAPAAPLAGAAYFPETGHNLAGDFLAYWQANGDLAQFGFPITEEREETLEDGNRYRVQYFERARFEYHPEHAGTPYAILLGQFGRRIEREAAHLTGDFGRLYFADQGVRDRLGAPIEAARQMVGATQEFERGRMFYLSEVETIYWGGDAPTIYVFAGGVQSGSLDNYGPRLAWPDTWREGEEIGGGPGPQPGLFLPQRGFGKVWRLGSGLLTPNLPPNAAVRDRLGYALTADETGYRLAVQRFNGGFMLSTPDGRFIYAIFTNQPSNGSALLGEYARYDVPAR